MSADSPLVSVVVPAYRHARFIGEALQSIYDQTHPRIELIVIDDASGDDTFEAAAEWASSQHAEDRFEGLHLLRNERNVGAHASINRGCLIARGKYLTVLNSDDYFHPDRFAVLVDAMARQSSELAFARVVPVDDDGRYIPGPLLPPGLVGAFDAADWACVNATSMIEALRARNVAISTGNLVFSRRVYDRIGPFAALKYVHDWDFVLRASLITSPIYVPQDLYFYRIHASNSFSSLADVAEIETRIVMARLETARTAARWQPKGPQEQAA